MKINIFDRVLHFKKPARTSRGEYTEHKIYIITIADEESKRFGMGECAPLPDLSCDRDAYPNIAAVGRLIEEALASDDYADYLRPYPALLFALESAMYEYQQNPMLYNTPFAQGEVGIPANGLVWMANYDNMLEQVKQKLKQGFRCIKLKIGAIGWEEEMQLLQFIRSRFSSDTLQLRVDANGAFRPEEAMSKLEQLAQLQIHSIEQPIQNDSQTAGDQRWLKMAELCRNTPIPIALDEELIGINSREEKIALLDTIRPQYIVVKPTLHGGMIGTMEWVSEAQKRGIGSWLTSALESNIGLRNVALLAASIYGPGLTMAQGLGTGLLYTDNIEMDVELRGNAIWRRK